MSVQREIPWFNIIVSQQQWARKETRALSIFLEPLPFNSHGPQDGPHSFLTLT